MLYVNGKREALQERALKIALTVSILAHGVLGAYLYHWQPQPVSLPPPETKIQLKLDSKTLPQPKQAKPDVFRPLPSLPVSQSVMETPLSQSVAVAAPAARTRGPAVEVSPVTTGTVPAPVRAEAAPASVARANAADVIAAFLARLEQRKEYPYIARKRGQTGTVTVQVRIGPTGELLEATVVGASGVARLDEAAIELVRRSCPFRHETGEELRMTVPIVYDLKEG